MAVGVPGDDSNATLVGGSETDNSANSAGAVRVYYLNPATSAWEYQAFIKKESSLSGNKAFGTTLAFNEDGSRLFVGNTETSAGAQKVQVFQRTGVSTWAFLANIAPTSPTSDANDNFGQHSIAAYGDVVAVSCTGEDGTGTGVNPVANNIGTNVGCAYVFRWNGSAYVQEAYIKPQTAAVNLQFGGKLSLYNNTLIVGNVSAAATLAEEYIEVFDYNGSNWVYTTRLESSNREAGDNFGTSQACHNNISIYGDFIVVGALGEDGTGTGINPVSNNSGTANGAAYLFKRTAGVWAQTAYFKGANTGSVDNFGVSAQIYNGKIIIGASQEDGSGTGLNPANNDSSSNAGAYYLFTYDETTGIPTQTYYIKNVFTPVAGTSLITGGQTGAKPVALGDSIVAIGFRIEDSDTTVTGIQYSTPNVIGTDTGAVFVYNI
jgi:hypothetical protein